MLIGLLTVYKLWLSTAFDVTGDEAHYWLWSQDLQASYYSKPPLVAWVIRMGTELLGNTALGLRWPAVLLSAATAALLFGFARRLYGAEAAWGTLLLACVTPMFALGSVVMTIDPLSVFFWVAGMAAFWWAKDSPGWSGWLLTGVCVGVGALAKYTNLAQLLSFLLFILWQADRRANPRQWLGLGLVLATTLLCFSPVIAWNAANQWITVTHLGESGNLDTGFRIKPLSVLEWFAGQAGVLSPLVFAGVLWLVLRPPEFVRGQPFWRYAVALFVPLFFGYTLLSFNRASNANWAALAYPALLVLLPAAWQGAKVNDRLRKRLARGTLILGGVMTGVFLLLPILVHTPLVPVNRAPFNRALGFESFASKVQGLRQEHAAPVVIAVDRGVASLLGFYLPGHPRTFIPTHDGVRNQFSLWPGYRDGAFGSRALVVVIDGRETLPDRVRQEFDRVGDLGTFTSTFGGRTVRTFRVYLAEGLRN